MSFIEEIIDLLWEISQWFYDAYQEVKDWVWPFYLLKYPLYAIYGRFMWLSEEFYDFSEWLEWAADLLGSVFSWTTIKSLIRSWLPGLEAAIDWFLSWTTWVGQYITDWWSGILPYILTYVDNAVGGLVDLATIWDNFWTVTWPQWMSLFDELVSSWDDFWTNIFPDLVSFTWLTTWWNGKLLEIDTLINSWFLAFAPFWSGWQEIRDNVLEFFADPLEWLWTRFTDWFLGPEV